MRAVYTAKSYSGETKGGEAQVKSERDLALQLRGEGFILTSFKEIKEDEKKAIEARLLDRLFGISLKDKLMFTQNLSVMISSGLPISRAVRNIADQTRNKRFRSILENVHKDIQSGLTFADGLAKYPGIFNDMFVNMVRVGEVSGNLEEIMRILTIQLEKEHSLTSKVKGAMTYPAVILVAMIAIAILMLTFILPRIMSVFSDMDVDLPASTKFVMALSSMLQSHAVALLVALAAAGTFLKFFLATRRGKKALAFFLMHVPVVKNIVVKVNCARFGRIYSSLIRSGVPVVESLRILEDTFTNYYYKQAMREGSEEIQKGTNLSVVIKRNSFAFPLLVSQMVSVGEETGKTDAVLLKLAEFYEDEVDQISKNMSSIIEPLLMLLIGGGVGFFAVSMLQPIYGLMQNVK